MNVGSFCDFAKVQFLDNYRDKRKEEGHFGQQDTTAKTGGSSGNVFFADGPGLVRNLILYICQHINFFFVERNLISSFSSELSGFASCFFLPDSHLTILNSNATNFFN